MQIVSTQRDPLYFLEKLRPREGGHAHGEACACDTRGSAAKRLSFSLHCAFESLSVLAVSLTKSFCPAKL